MGHFEFQTMKEMGDIGTPLKSQSQKFEEQIRPALRKKLEVR